MSHVICYTSANIAYLDRALVLESSVRKSNPNWRMVLVLVDSEENAAANAQALSRFDEVILSRELIGIDHDSWIFGHNVVEACTAVKGAALVRLLQDQPRAVVYLDPDTYVFSDMEPVLRKADNSDLCVTPHQLTPATTPKGIEDNEIGSLRHGIFNLGFLIVRPTSEGRRFARWWDDRLREYCIDDSQRGLFTDQKWIDHAPVFFPGTQIMRDPGLNVASWNLDNRRVGTDKRGRYNVDGSPLYFWHFTKAESVGPLMTLRHGARDAAVVEAWRFYMEQLALSRLLVDARPWAFQAFQNGTEISPETRRVYRRRHDLRGSFPKPFATESPSLMEWVIASESPGIS